MKLALLVPGPFSTVSGGYNYDRRLVDGLRALGHQVEIVELAGHHPLADAAALASATAALAATPDDTRLIIDGLGLPAFAPHAAALTARRVAALIHHPTALEPGFTDAERDTLRTTERILFAACAKLVVTSALTAREMAESFGLDPTRIAVVEPGTDPAPRAQGSGGPTTRILSVGTLVKRKGHDVLLRCLARLPDLDWHLTIAGAPRDPVLADGLHSLAEELNIARRVSFAGEVTGEALEALYAKADLFALATHWEGYGMAAAEAMARGLPLAITAGGAISEIVPVGAAIVSPPGDLVSFTKGLRRIIYDTELRAEMAEAAWSAGQTLPRWSDRAALFLDAIA